jgi:hypothetical protein
VQGEALFLFKKIDGQWGGFISFFFISFQGGARGMLATFQGIVDNHNQ